MAVYSCEAMCQVIWREVKARRSPNELFPHFQRSLCCLVNADTSVFQYARLAASYDAGGVIILNDLQGETQTKFTNSVLLLTMN
jgi:hypothetical protein